MVNKIKIALISTEKANLPEIEAYKEYFRSHLMSLLLIKMMI